LLCDIPVVFITALSELASEAKGLALGAVDYITKPINVDIARQRIRNLLAREQLRKEVQHQKNLLDAQVVELKTSEEKLHLAASVFTCAREAIMITAADGTIIDVNKSFQYITGYLREDVLGGKPSILNSGRQEQDFFGAMWRDLIDKGHWYGEVWNRRKSGEVFAVMQTISAVRGKDGKTEHFVSLFSDITASKTHQQELEHIAHYDALTGLPNRALLADRLHQGLAQAHRRGQFLAVVFLDLDGFKSINDNHGHEAGDHLLVALAVRMKQALRDGDTLARLGGDEFVAVLVDLPDVATCVPMLTRLLAAAAQPVKLGVLTLQVSASLGVAFTPPNNDTDADQLLRQADQAMYQAKLAGKNRYHVFDAEQDRSVRGHHESLDHIRHALSQRQFVLHYQPKVNMRTGKVIGAEALIRWQHPHQGLLPPAMFLPIIEDHSLAIDIGEWVIDTAMTQMEKWHAVGLDLPVSVNVGARQLQQANFVERLRATLARHPTIKPSCIELEILETSALEDVAGVSIAIEACRDIGIMFALDDFGTGYSSLTYLKRLSVSLLKIDQSFVRDMLTDPDDLAILEGVVGLASAFRRSVIAEGVETIEHGTMLLQLGCDWAQGYGIARPMPAEAMPNWVKTWRPDAAWGDVPVVSREGLPLLFACVEHRAWVASLVDFLNDKRDTPQQLDHQECRFGRWLVSEGQTLYGAHPALPEIGILHQQVHTLAIELIGLDTTQPRSKALVRVNELYALRDALLEKLKQLSHKKAL
jgi:diguanylate cyclase (GGDEF)-like protein/PAS domain S-box-containing protein